MLLSIDMTHSTLEPDVHCTHHFHMDTALITEDVNVGTDVPIQLLTKRLRGRYPDAARQGAFGLTSLVLQTVETSQELAHADG